ncbi:MAG: VWA domain-containing protein [Rhodobacteraceae bacterium]|nr:VWA domain-containing protein [Paracoccaceae bacterium]
MVFHRLGKWVGCVVLSAVTLATPIEATAQNLLVNGDFEADSVPNYGDNAGVTITGWMRYGEDPVPSTPSQYREVFLTKVDGPGGQPVTEMTMIPAPVNAPILNAGQYPIPESDVTHGGAAQDAHFVRVGGGGGPLLFQHFRAPETGCAIFGVSLHSYVSNPAPWLLRMGQINEPAWTAAVAANQPQIVPPSAFFNGPVAVAQSGLAVTPFAWSDFYGFAPVTGGEVYRYMQVLPSTAAIDDAYVQYVDNANCPSIPAGTPNPPNVTIHDVPTPPVSALTPQDVTLTKTCQPPVPHTHAGVLGQRWECQVAVNVASAPFAGDIILHDVFTNTPLVTGQILLGQSASGNGTCFQGDCLINGANFDASGTEIFEFDVYVEATDVAEVYPLENCVTGEVDDGTGATQPLGQSCTTAQWVPRSEVTKTCEPIPEGATAPYTMNCRIDVTASGLVGGTFVSVMDAFVAQPPSVATVTPTFMNVTSSENWDCVDHQLNAPSSVGICELSAEDMMAAGGVSSLNISFQFDVDQAPTQVANCRFTDLHEGSFLAQLSGQRSAMRSPIQGGSGQGGWPQMPDGCVYVDVPAPALETKVKAEAKKTCDQPHLSNQNGVWGYLWQCEAEIVVTPSPFAGSFTFVDDGSQISMGTASFIAVSDPNNCQGLQTDTLTCTYQGSSFASPHHVQYDLFTPYIATDEEITWKNCIEGEAVTAAGSFPTVPMCTGRTIKPRDIPDLKPLEEVSLKKSCGDAYEAKYEGETGLGWDCKITVTAEPAPFAGSFTFTEDATAIIGSNGLIVDMQQPMPNDWTCAPGLPSASTDCTISGSAFDPSGVETLSFSLFAPDTGAPVTWKNCVSGVYADGNGESRAVDGNCESITWKPPVISDPPEFSLKKSCRGPDAYQQSQRYLCTIHITQTGGGAITQPLTLNELFSSTTTGQLATQYMLMLQGSTGWVCDMASASCTIQPNDFNGVSGHQINGMFLIPNGILAEQDFENCAALSMGDQEVATAPCVGLDEPKEAAEFDVTKECKALGDRQVMGPNAWFQQMECTITVTSNGVPFTDPLWIDEDMLYGSHNGAASVASIQSADPWQCSPPPYGPQGNQPVCGIQGSQFPHAAGQSTLMVTLNLFGALADPYGAQNCVALSMGDVPGSDPADVIAEDCVEIIPTPEPKEPQIDLVKSCEGATSLGNGQWAVNCTLTITGQNLPAGEPLRVMDELMSSSTQTALFGQMNAPTNACGGGAIAGGVTSGCDLSTDDIIAAGGTLVVPYTGTYQGPGGRPINGPQAQNCAYVDVPGLNLHGPQGGNGKSCVPVEFKLDLSSTGGSIDPAAPGGSIDAVGGVSVPAVVPTGPPELDIAKACAPATALDGNQWELECTLTLTVRNLPHGEHVKIDDVLREVPGVVVQSSAWHGAGVNCTSSNLGAACFIPTNNFGPGAFGPGGETLVIPYTATIFVANTAAAPTLGTENCVRTTMFYNGAWTESPASNGVPFRMLCVPVEFDMTSVIDPVTGPLTGDAQSCSIDTLFVVDRSGSMGGTRLHLTKQALAAAMATFEGQGSRSGLVLFNSNAHVAGASSAVLPSQALNAEIAQISAGGGTNWEAAMQKANQAIAGMADKPLVLFVTDGQPTVANTPPSTANTSNYSYFLNSATPYLNAIRAQGSRVVGITIGSGALTANMTQFLGPNLVTASASSTVDPRVNDVIEIPNLSLMLPTFEQIAQAYCPERTGVSAKAKRALMQQLSGMPKAAFVYQGDDELPEEQMADASSQVDAVPAAPFVEPVLEVLKTQTSECIADRNTQRYTCGFRLSVMNTGSTPFSGPMVVTDTFASPYAQAIAQQSGGGWSCAQPVAGAVLCEHAGLTLTPGAFAYIDLSMEVQGLVNGGLWENCAAVGIPQDRAQRVAAIQQVMNARGLNAGPVDGKPGKKTYRALAQLRKSLGLPKGRNFDDALFKALGIPLMKPGEKSCVLADLPPMPKPPIQCDRATTVQKGESCQCRFDNMIRRNATACQCKGGFAFVAGKGCVKKTAPKPAPPREDTLNCDKRSARLVDGRCVCRDPKNAVKTSKTTCGCKNGTPMIGGKCVNIQVIPRPGLGTPGGPVGTGDAVDGDGRTCTLRLNNVCLKWK